MTNLKKSFFVVIVFLAGNLTGFYGKNYISKINSWGQIKEHHETVKNPPPWLTKKEGDWTVIEDLPKIKPALWYLVSRGEINFVDTIITSVNHNIFTSSFIADTLMRGRMSECFVYSEYPPIVSDDEVTENIHLKLWTKKDCKKEVDYLIKAVKKVDEIQSELDSEKELKEKLISYFKKEFPEPVSEGFIKTVKKKYLEIDITERR